MSLTAVEAEMKRIWDERGDLTPALVLEQASPPGSILHGQFEWDDGEAAHRYRLAQAAGLIRSVKLRVTRVENDGTVTDYKIRAWASAAQAELPGANPGSYVPMGTLSGNDRKVLLQRMQRDMTAIRRRYGGLAEFWEQIDAMQQKQHGQAG